MYESIVVPLDSPTSSAAALAFGAHLAGRAGVPLRLVTVASPHLDHSDDRQLLAKVAVDLAVSNPQTEIVESNDVVRALLDLVGTHHLLCVQTRGHRALSTAVLGGMTRRLVSQASSPLVLVGPRADADRPLELMDVAVDLRDSFDRLLPVLAQWHRDFGVRFRLIHVWGPRDRSIGAYETSRQLTLSGARLAQEVGTGSEKALLAGPAAAEAIATDVAVHHAAIVALNHHHRRFLGHETTGSMASEVARVATAAVLVMPDLPAAGEL